MSKDGSERHRLSPADLAKKQIAIEMLKEGAPYKRISALVDYSEAWVSHLAKREGLERYGKGRQSRRKKEE